MKQFSWGRVALAVVLVVVVVGTLVSLRPSTNGMLPPDEQLRAPDFTLPLVRLGGLVHLSAETERHPVVLSFWATWCGPCRQELPHLDALARRFQGRVAFYGIDSTDQPSQIESYAAGNGVNLPMLSDASGEVATKYGVTAIPALLVIDTRGKVVWSTVGFNPEIDTDLPAILDQVIAGKH